MTNMTPEDIEHLQTIGRDAQNARKEFILKDDQSAAWEHIMTLKDARIDFVLDNGESIHHWQVPRCALNLISFVCYSWFRSQPFISSICTGDTNIHHSFSLISSLRTFLYPTPHMFPKSYSSQSVVSFTYHSRS